MEKVSPHKRQIASIAVYLFFITLISFALFSGKAISPGVQISLSLVLAFLVSMIFYQLSVWKVTRDNDCIQISSFFGLYRITFNPVTDFLSGNGFVLRNSNADRKFYAGKETGQMLTLKTTKGKFRFSSENYADYDEVLRILLSDNPKIKRQYYDSLKDERKKYNNRQDWLIAAALVGAGFLIYFIFKQGRF